MSERKPNLIERFLYGPRGASPADRGESKGVFPYDETNSRYWSNWSGPSYPMSVMGTYGTSVDYTVDAGDLIDSSAVMVCLNWLMMNFPKSPPRVVLETEDGLEPVPNHSLTRLLKRPNPFYSGTDLWRATILSYKWNGNAYWRKIRNSAGQVLQLWHEPHFTIRPVRTNANEFISKYQIWRDKAWRDVPVEDIVHFRWTLSPGEQMLGMGFLDSALREIFTDNEASRYAAIMFRNLGVPGIVVTPKSVDDEIGEPQRLKAELRALTTGDNRGDPLVYSVPIDMQFPQIDPTKMNTRDNRKISEERVSALLGTPAQVVGLGAGLDRNILGSPEEALRWAYENNIIPTQDSMAETLDIQLLPDFSSIDAETIEFDQSKISVLKGDIQKKEMATAVLWNGNAITRAQLKLRLGMKPATDGSDDFYKFELVKSSAPIAIAPPASEPPTDNVPPDQQPTDNVPPDKALAVLISQNGHNGGVK